MGAAVGDLRFAPLTHHAVARTAISLSKSPPKRACRKFFYGNRSLLGERIMTGARKLVRTRSISDASLHSVSAICCSLSVLQKSAGPSRLIAPISWSQAEGNAHLGPASAN